MEGNPKVNSPYLPFFLGKDELGTPAEGTQSIDEPKQYRDVKLTPDSFMEYPAKISDLRVMGPYAHELEQRLGKTCYVLQCRKSFSLNSVPNEWKHKVGSFLWEVSVPGGSPAYVADSDLSTFYFKDQAAFRFFLGKMNGADSGPSLDEMLAQRDRLRKLLG